MHNNRTGRDLTSARMRSVGAGVAELRYVAVPARAEQLATLRHALAAWADEIGMDAEHAHAVVLASYEALANVVTHAYSAGTGTVDLYAVYRPETARVQVTVRDQGRWRAAATELGPLHGRGVPLMRHLAETVELERGAEGTTVRLSWSHPARLSETDRHQL